MSKIVHLRAIVPREFTLADRSPLRRGQMRRLTARVGESASVVQTPIPLTRLRKGRAQREFLVSHDIDGGTRGSNQRSRPNQVNRAAHLDFALASHERAVLGAHVGRARDDRPALGHVGRGIGTWGRANLQHIPGCDLAGKSHPCALVSGFIYDAHLKTLVDGALYAHKPSPRRGVTSTQVAIGESAIERPCEPCLQLVQLALIELDPGERGIERLTITAHDVVHVIGPLHATLDLKGRDSGANQRGNMTDPQVITRAQQAVALCGGASGAPRLGNVPLPRPAREQTALIVLKRIGQTTGLGAVPAVGRTPAHESRIGARARITDADGAMTERLDGRSPSAKTRELRQGQFARARHA